MAKPLLYERLLMKTELNLTLNSLNPKKQNAFTRTKKHGLAYILVACLNAIPLHSYAADPNKVIHTYFSGAETGFDPVATNDTYSSYVDASIFETLYTYDYLARPLKLIPLTAVDLPQISADGLTYTIKIKPGIYFSNDPVFNGKKRELTSYDYAYSLKRLLDPKLHSPNSWLIEGKLLGSQEFVDKAKKTGTFDYNSKFSGIETPDRYTLILRLNEKDYNLPMILAHGPTAAVAKEAIEKYKNNIGYAMANPVGTGPYLLTKWVRASRIVLTANPDYRGYIWNFKSKDFNDRKIVAEMTDKKMPQVGVVDIQIIGEAQSQWLAFKQKQLDWINLPANMVGDVIEHGELKPEYKQAGMTLSSIPDLVAYYAFWNMKDPVVGGLTKDKIALRKAIMMSFSKEKYLNVLSNGVGIPLNSPIPPNIVGYDPNYQSATPYSVRAANLLLDKYNYKVGADGYRTLPNGKPLTIIYSTPSSGNSAVSDFWQRSLKAIHIRFVNKTMQFPDYLKAQKQCVLQMGIQGWVADYPDGDNFLQLFYGPNTYASNFGCTSIPEFDKLYAQSKALPAGPERQELYLKMARILDVNAAIMPISTPYENTVIQPYIQGYKSHPMLSTPWMYVDITKPTN